MEHQLTNPGGAHEYRPLYMTLRMATNAGELHIIYRILCISLSLVQYSWDNPVQRQKLQ